MSTPEISIVIAAYNYGRFLAGTLDSVLAQTYRDWEAIIVDDGSTDNTQEVVEAYLGDRRIRYYRTDHVGQSAAKNAGIQKTTAPLVCILDADDLWLPPKLELQRTLFRDDLELGVAYTRRLVMDEDGFLLQYDQPTLHRGQVLPKMFKDNFVCHSSVMIRRQVLEEVGMFDESIPMAIDYDLWLRIAARYRFDYVDEPCVVYRTGHANLSRRSEGRLMSVLGIMRRFLEEHGGRELLKGAVVRRAFAETYTHIGMAKARQSRLAALPWLLRAVATSPGHGYCWKQMGATSLPMIARQFVRRALGRPVETFNRQRLSDNPMALDLLGDACPDHDPSVGRKS